jgi:DNA-binding GntR family transcriptional regulator
LTNTKTGHATAATRIGTTRSTIFSTNERLTKSTYAYQHLRRRILEGELEPGSRLLLRDLAQQMGLSIQPVRDAIKSLVSDGLAETESYRSATVTQISGSSVLDLLSARMWLEALAVQQAVPLHTETSLEAVKDALGDTAQLIGAHEGPLQYSHANRRLHEAVEAPAPEHLRALIYDLWEKLWETRRRSSLFSLEPTSTRSAYREHKELVAAVTGRDAQSAASAMMEHRESTLAAWRKALDKLSS